MNLHVLLMLAAGPLAPLAGLHTADAPAAEPTEVRWMNGAVAGFGRIADVARRGGRLLFATTRPASPRVTGS